MNALLGLLFHLLGCLPANFNCGLREFVNIINDEKNRF